MPVAVQFYFDKRSIQSFEVLWSRMDHEGLGTWMKNIGTEPHLSLAVFDDDVDHEVLLEVSRRFVETVPRFQIDLATVGAFPGESHVVYVAPVPTAELLALHRRYHSSLAQAGLEARSYYRPGEWVPHCTTAAKIEATAVAPTIDLWLRHFEFGITRCCSLGIVEVPPVEEIARWDLQPTPKSLAAADE